VAPFDPLVPKIWQWVTLPYCPSDKGDPGCANDGQSDPGEGSKGLRRKDAQVEQQKRELVEGDDKFVKDLSKVKPLS
jgi:hypothetical protein